MTTWESIRYGDLGVLKESLWSFARSGWRFWYDWLGTLSVWWFRVCSLDSRAFVDWDVYNGWLESMWGLMIDKFIGVDLEVCSKWLGSQRV